MTVFEDGDWRLVDGVWKTISIMHRCGPGGPEVDPGDRDGWWFYVQHGVCNSCLEPAPDKLIGLQILTNWER